MTSVLKSPDNMPSSRSGSGNLVLDTIADRPLSVVMDSEYDRHSSLSSRSISPATRYGSPRQSDQDVPFFTVARYRNPTAPTTYELAAVPSFSSTPEIPECLPDLLTSPAAGGGETYYNGSLDLSPVSPVELAFGKVHDNNGEWLGKSIIQSPRTPKDELDRSLSSSSSASQGLFSPRTHEATSVGCIHEASGNLQRLSEESSHLKQSEKASSEVKAYAETPVRGCVNFSIEFPKSPTSTTKPKPHLKPKPKEKLSRRTSAPPSDHISEDYYEVSNKRVHRKSLSGDAYEVDDNFQRKLVGVKLNISKKSCDNNLVERKATVYEDAGVTDAAEVIENKNIPIPKTPRSKTREPSFCLDLQDNNYPKTDAEYVALLQKRIAEAHERQLLPLKEDLADWISKLLEVENLTMDNLISNLDNGVILCRLAGLISSKAQEARDKGISSLEVPRLPYRTWGRARSGTFFARDNITNFIRFCKRLGVHSNLLFETEDLVCGTGVRGVVLCLLEVGRLGQLWWGLEPPGLVKLERELDGEELSGRSDSGYSNTSSPRNSTLALHSNSPLSQNVKNSRPVSAPSQLHIPKLNLSDSGTKNKPNVPRGPKPTPPPKPASIKKAVSNITKRPSSFPTSRSYDRGWSGAKTTPTTPVTTPTHAPKTRLPVAKTPRSSGRSTPNTTPTTPTQCRRYLVSMQRTPSQIPTPRPIQKPLQGKPPTKIPSRSPSFCSRLQDALKSPNPEDEARVIRSDLDNKVQSIAQQTQGLCNCTDISCPKNHIKRVSDGKYDILGKSVFVRLLKGKHVMVRVGGGWDTLEHYLLRHDPTQVRLFRPKANGSDPSYLHIRSRYKSPSPSEKSFRKTSSSKQSSCSESSLKTNSSRTDDGCYSGHSSPTDTATDLMDDNQPVLESLEEVSPNSDLIDDKTLVPDPSNEDATPEEPVGQSQVCPKKDSLVTEEECSFRCPESNHLGCCDMISAPMGEHGDFQPPPSSLSTTSLNKMVTSCPTLDLAESISDLTSDVRKYESENSECDDLSSVVSDNDK